LERAGFSVKRQRGSHIIMRHDERSLMVVVPDHREIDPRTLRAILRQAEMTIPEFVELLQD